MSRIKTISGLLQPMIAVTHDPQRDVGPWLVQPKLDGVRCLALRGNNGGVVLRSRSGQSFRGLDAIRARLRAAMVPGEVWDGELWLPGADCQAVMNDVHLGGQLCALYLFDVLKGHDPATGQLEDHRPFSQRITRLRTLPSMAAFPDLCVGGGIFHVPAVRASGPRAPAYCCRHFCATGYEGAILRTPDALYYSGETDHLQKLKPFAGTEFNAIGYTTARDGSTVFTLQTPGGAHFRARWHRRLSHPWCRPFRTATSGEESGTDPLLVKVRHQGVTANGIPRHPHVVCVRPTWDL